MDTPRTSIIPINGLEFRFIQEIIPDEDESGKLKEFYPEEAYKNRGSVTMHRYGRGPFCQFRISKQWKTVPGVYALLLDQEIIYIGQCIDAFKRFNDGYGHISPRNCYSNGQSTNCKINKMILEESKQGKRILLYFHQTADYKDIEKDLIQNMKPKHNAYLSCSSKEYTTVKKEARNNIIRSGLKKSIADYIEKLMQEEKVRGATEIVVVSGEIHRSMELKAKMPSVCDAMYSLMTDKDLVLRTTKSGKSSTIIVQYDLKQR